VNLAVPAPNRDQGLVSASARFVGGVHARSRSNGERRAGVRFLFQRGSLGQNLSMSTPSSVPVTAEEMNRLIAECRKLPVAAGAYASENFEPYDDFITNVLLTVLDLQMHNVAVNKSILHYRTHRWADVRTLEDLERVLREFPDTGAGNRAAAQYLWGNNYWTRIQWLRGFVSFLREQNLTSQEALKAWAVACEFDRDFAGRVKHLGIAACQWLRMRLGVDTVKPDVHTHRFVTRAIGRRLSDSAVVTVIEEAAGRLDMRARALDNAIWEAQRGAPGSI